MTLLPKRIKYHVPYSLIWLWTACRLNTIYLAFFSIKRHLENTCLPKNTHPSSLSTNYFSYEIADLVCLLNDKILAGDPSNNSDILFRKAPQARSKLFCIFSLHFFYRMSFLKKLSFHFNSYNFSRSNNFHTKR